jgi:hypothetical protein
MSAWSQSLSHHELLLSGSEGQLVTLRVTADPRHLESLLETLAELRFPVNPQIIHQFEDGALTAVEFPAFDGRIPEVEVALRHGGFPPGSLEVLPPL